MKKIFPAFARALLFLVLIPLAAGGGREQGETLRVIASDSILGDVVAVLGAGNIDLVLLAGPGEDLHDFEPSPQDIIGLEEADLIFSSSELSFLERFAHLRLVSEGVDFIEDEHGDHDPHVWFDPVNVIIWTENISRELSQADPANAAVYAGKAEQYIRELEALDAEIQTSINSSQLRTIVTGHDVLSYFSSKYDVEVIGSIIPAISHEAEPTPRHLAELAEKLRVSGGAVIAIGAELRRLAEELAGEVSADTPVVEILTDSLAETGAPGDSYLSFMRYNVGILTGATTEN